MCPISKKYPVTALFLLISMITQFTESITDSVTITQDEFNTAVTSLGYSTPSSEQYQAFQLSIETKGGITSRQEAAMALTHFLWESDGLRAKREYQCQDTGCPGSYETPGCDLANGARYFGRGYVQLTWCYNYRQASMDLYGDERLVTDPDSVARDEEIAWDTAFWFWRTNVHSAPGVAEGMFGATTRVINGDLECAQGTDSQQGVARHRFEMYKTVRSAFGLDPNSADERGCYN